MLNIHCLNGIIKCLNGQLKFEGEYNNILAEIDINEAVFNCCVKNKWILLEMTSNAKRLEDIFRDLTINR